MSSAMQGARWHWP